MVWRWVGVAVIAGAAGAAWWWTSRPPAPPRTDWRMRAAILAGTGVAGLQDGPALDGAELAQPFGLATLPTGALVLTDGDRLRLLSPAGTVTLLAGADAGFRDGPSSSARFSSPSAVATGPDGTIHLADTGNHAIRTIGPDGHVSTLAGTGRPGHRDGAPDQAEFNGPVGLARDARGHLYVADTYNDAIREIGLGGRVSTLAGGDGPGFADGLGAEARFDTPTGLTMLPSGDLLVADAGNGRLRRIDRTTGRVTTVTLDGAGLATPLDVVADAAGVAFVSDERGAVVRIEPEGRARVVAGGAGSGFANGLGAGARFRRPAGLAWVAPGRLALADTGNALVRLLTDPLEPSLEPAIEPPPSPRVAPRFDVAQFRRVPLLWPVAPFDGPHEVAGTHGERRGTDGAERFHMGVDIRMPQGTPVHAVRAGVVTSPLGNGGVGTLNEWVRVGDVAYVHIRAGRDAREDSIDTTRYAVAREPDGALGRLRIRRGARFETGDRVGTVNRFNHVHLAVGWPGDDHNPLGLRLLQFADTIPPTIAPGGIRLFSAGGQPLDVIRDGRVLVHGRVQIVVDAWDQADGNVPWRRLGLHTLGYQVLRPDGTPVEGFETPRITQRFDRLAPDGDAARLVYAPGSGIPVYGNRRTRFLYVVTTRLEEGVATWDAWDTRTLAPGDYVLRVHAADIAGNVAVARRDVPVTVAARPAAALTAG